MSEGRGYFIRNGVKFAGSANDAINVNYDDTSSKLSAATVQKAIDNLSVVSTYTLDTASWAASESEYYPYMYTVQDTKYTEDSSPIWGVSVTTVPPTETETEEMNKVALAYFSSTGIVLYATEQPGIDLTLNVKGA